MGIFVASVATHVGNVREHNEDNHLLDTESLVFAVADGMGGHAAGEVASAAAVGVVHQAWTDDAMRRRIALYARRGDASARRSLLQMVADGVKNAHLHIVEEARADPKKSGMGTTFTGFLVAGGDAVFAHAGDSRAYLVRDGFTSQLTEDQTVLARMRAAGLSEPGKGEVDMSRWKGVLTNALGVGDGTRVATFIVPLYAGDRLLLCSDGVHEYVSEREIGELLVQSPSPARAAQRFVDLALERGGHDNATALVVKVVEVDETAIPPEQRARDEATLSACPLLVELSPQERLRALRIASERDIAAAENLPPVALEDRVAYLVLEGEVAWHGRSFGPGSLIYPEGLVQGAAPPAPEAIAQARTGLRVLLLRRDDFRELAEDDAALGVRLYAALTKLMI
jgi:serine/threonine protein phosphatase PrpC